MNDLSRYILAIVLAMIILFSWQILFPVEQSEYSQEEDNIDLSIEEIEISKINNALVHRISANAPFLFLQFKH